ncbi:BNR repeat-containing protein [Marilutibacter chinensis]|uniref:BNR-4 repeat-containing protein n=1 Tax=Marilutibacter chinensis TaxID=2912247 RepID=A0ABS9HUZ1_9GAMM|nr:BNR repeat-containing protein [Lysobacter chinensis]MCF7222326.1 BNR-4 repeat-containing protein [Lysobacter chinensis]
MKTQISTTLAVLFLLPLLPLSAIAQAHAGLDLVRDTVITTNGMNFTTGAYGTSMNGQSFQQEGLVTFKGYQYAAYWDDSGALGIGRRALPDGDWETLVFDDYSINHNDAHNVNVVGISPEDGTIHLSFNHHNSPLRHRRSVPGLATDPENFAWTQNNFGPIRSELVPGMTITPDVTYPLFFTSPQGKLQFVFRLGGSGSGDWHFYEYGATGWKYVGMLFSRLGSYAGKGRRCAYPNPFRYDRNGRLHVTWSWREDGTSLNGNHDLGYAYSDDYGRTWKNNDGAVMVTLDGTNNLENAIKVTTPGHVAYPIAYNRGYMNTTTQTVDSKGRVHVVAWRLPDDGSPSNPVNLNDWRYFHYWRDTDGTWTETQLPFFGRKPQLVLDDSGRMHVVFGSGSDLNYQPVDPGATLTIATSTEAGGWSDWTIAEGVTGRTYHGEVLLDMGRWYAEGVLTAYYQQKPGIAGAGSSLRAIDFIPAGGDGLPPPANRIELTASDIWDQTSFAAGGHWSDGRTPHADGAYVVDGLDLRTPSSGTSHIFGGDSLLLHNGGRLLMRTTSQGGVTVHDLRSDDGVVTLALNGAFTLAGALTLEAGGLEVNPATSNRTLTIASRIDGPGALTIDMADAMDHTMLTNAANTYSGGTIVSAGTLRAHADHALGAGDVTVASGARLRLAQGAVHDYVADDALLVVGSTASVELAYIGNDIVGALSLDGGASFVAPGEWGAVGSGAANTSSRFTGTGLLWVVGGE